MTNQMPIGGRAEILAQNGRVPEALALLHDAAASKDPDACFSLALWHLAGRFVPRDLARTRAYLRAARELGDADAAAMEIALTANGTGAPADWSGALRLLRGAALRNSTAAAELKLVEAMDLADDGKPTRLPKAEQLVPDGAVIRFQNLLTAGECELIAQAAAGWLEPAVVVDPRTGQQVRHPHRTSDGAVLGPTRETLPIRAINQRIAAISGTATEQGEALIVLRYAPGQEFRPHLDALPNTHNQRVITVLVYLNDTNGGETRFPTYGLDVKPRMGDAILFRNTLPGGSPDPRAIHAGAPVTQGVKWLATRWIRARPFDVWSGPESAA
ncbi:2OG-Fe(II) oxygenase [Sphingomonas xinjiangensis]|uniref:Prolyl 4-hydroxylase n=1 Tax=Sphingomonas xinjiangensis TaxID=643568 RepID=A0A840YHQ1_9SPHN|nr:2OG-Fe(II) oxygenase [Sphingomonas xinjiangensis]MBB5710348.1 prolyl 4-hydroxylase [Sphingomonas xinjiangensis]